MDSGPKCSSQVDVEKGLLASSAARPSVHPPGDIDVRMFRPGDEIAFREINESWISKLFTVEERDREILSDPAKHILARGGEILMVVAGETAIGCCALVPMEDGSFEVSKMGISEAYRGRGVGRRLLTSVIQHARSTGIRRLYLETSSKLANAIHLYEALQFRHLPPERVHPSPYARANVYMELILY